MNTLQLFCHITSNPCVVKDRTEGANNAITNTAHTPAGREEKFDANLAHSRSCSPVVVVVMKNSCGRIFFCPRAPTAGAFCCGIQDSFASFQLCEWWMPFLFRHSRNWIGCYTSQRSPNAILNKKKRPRRSAKVGAGKFVQIRVKSFALALFPKCPSP